VARLVVAVDFADASLRPAAIRVAAAESRPGVLDVRWLFEPFAAGDEPDGYRVYANASVGFGSGGFGSSPFGGGTDLSLDALADVAHAAGAAWQHAAITPTSSGTLSLSVVAYNAAGDADPSDSILATVITAPPLAVDGLAGDAV
jgi:hypothetical protein